ncbi:MAG: hypothetical protein EOO41_04640, partial [Methanobacteriota archaeon]
MSLLCAALAWQKAYHEAMTALFHARTSSKLGADYVSAVPRGLLDAAGCLLPPYDPKAPAAGGSTNPRAAATVRGAGR